LSILFLATLLSACQNNDSSAPPPEKKIAPKPIDEKALKAYRDNSCAFPAKNNGGAVFEYLNQQRRESSYFEKHLNIYLLAGIMPADIESGLQFISQSSVKIFKVPSEKEGCKNYSILSDPPNQIMQVWTQLNESLGDKDAFVLGLFMPVDKLRSLGISLEEPVIIYREDTEKWTLVHEYLHFLFNKDRETQGEFVMANLKQMEKVGADFDAKTKNATETQIKNPSFLKEVAALFQDHENRLLNHLRNFTLEEMTIETELIALYEAKNMKYTTEYAKLGAAWYIRSSYKNFIQIINGEMEIHQQLKKYAGDLGLQDVVQTFEGFEQNLKSVSDQAQDLDEEARKIGEAIQGNNNKNNIVKSNPTSKVLGDLQSTPLPHKKCAHEIKIKPLRPFHLLPS
jgi:hypothetical protein